MRPIRRGFWLSLAALMSGLALAVPANAQALGNGNEPQPGGVTGGGGVTAEGAAPAMPQQANDKVAATLAWDAAMQAGDTAGAAKAADVYTARWGGAGAGSQVMSLSVTPSLATPVSKSLGVVQVGQEKSFYCGPAAGYEIIRYLHGAGFTSRYNGNALTQNNLANPDHMDTLARQVTDWSSGKYVFGLNRWRGNGYYVQVHAPSASLLTAVFTNSINWNGMPFSGDTVEFLNGPHYNGHPNRLIGHWITAYAYTSSGASGNWADSSTTYYPNAARYFPYNTSSFSTFLQSNGIAY